MTPDLHPGLESRLAEMYAMLLRIEERLDGPKPSRECYTVEEAAKALGKRPYTVREWCRAGRITASKRSERRGGAELWSVSADEITRYKNEGFLPVDATRNSN